MNRQEKAVREKRSKRYSREWKIWCAVQVRYGRGPCPKGFLPVMSCDTEDECKALLIASCSFGGDGHYYADELAMDQSLPSLERFAQKLEQRYEIIKANTVRQVEAIRAPRARKAR